MAQLQRDGSKHSISFRASTASRDDSIFSQIQAEDDYEDETNIEWSNLIFLPFHPIFKLIVLVLGIVKNILGPIQSVYPIVNCWDVMDKNEFLILIKYTYLYAGDAIYAIDVFLHIVHRQVTDKALRREYLPKSALLIALDITALIPFFRLISDNDCPEVMLWPNVLAFSEFSTIYRVVEYFSLVTTHSFWNLLIGFTLTSICCMNCATCFWLLLTHHGLCGNCREEIFDWRNNFLAKYNESSSIPYTTYVYGSVYIATATFSLTIDDTKSMLLLEFISVSVFSIVGYFLIIFVITPKVFAESILQLRRICTGYTQVGRLIEETQRRNPFPKAHLKVENFYKAIWRKRSGITHIPEVISELPRYLRIEIKQDLGWPLFYHSPILRKRSIPFKRFVCDTVTQDFKLSGERFFSGPHTHSSLYYLKSGIVQILSGDDGTTPVLSVTSGTIFGDVSFFVPPYHRRVNLKCLTYCELLVLSRRDYIKALHKYPEDRRHILKLVKERLKHAKTLYNCKQNVEGLDRAEDEGISWLKRRWWEISKYLAHWNRKGKKDHMKCELPPEETVYHCAKFIGQLVLCTDTQLLTKSLFANVNFPWTLVPHSKFTFIWHKIVMCTIFLVAILYPPNITRREIPTWFKFFQVWTDMIYIADIGISLLTAVTVRDTSAINFASVMFARCKTLNFNLDLLATVWIEYIFIIIGKPQFFNVVQFNRLIKMYQIFAGIHDNGDVRKNPMISAFMWVAMTISSFYYISCYLVYAIDLFEPNLTTNYFFGDKYCKFQRIEGGCDPGSKHVVGIILSWIMEWMFFAAYVPKTMLDIYIGGLLNLLAMSIALYCKGVIVAALYLNHRETTNYQFFVSNLKNYYKHYKIHQDLQKRLDKYLMCHWKYYKGADVMHPNVLKYEPYDVYWKVQGEVAEKIIGESKAFQDTDPGLIKDLAFAARFLILPKGSTIFLFGVQCKNVTWIVQGTIKCEYHDDKGDLLKEFYQSGYMLSASAVFLGKASLRTYSASTDCEILYIKKQDFFKIIEHYPHEWGIMSKCISEFAPVFEEMFHTYVKKHRDYQKRLRNRIFHARRSTAIIKRSIGNLTSIVPIQHDFWTAPESDFIQYWLLFRMVIAIVSMVNASLQGGSGALYRRSLIMIGAFCDCIAWIDIVLKLFVAYYDERGILIYDKKKCVITYLTRSFCLDLIGALPWFEILRALMSSTIKHDDILLLNTFCKFAHIYMVTGYFHYLADVPTLNNGYIMIFKWQVLMILLIFGTSHFMMNYCVDLTFNDRGDLIEMVYLNTCWMPKYLDVRNMSTEHQLHTIFAASFSLAENSLMGLYFGKFEVDHDNDGVGFAVIILMMIFWYATGYSLTMLVLNSRGNSLFRHGVNQLKHFLKEERVDKKIIKRATDHFTYWWMRTKGINIHHLSNERIGVVFRQDLSYYFFKKTFLALDTLLHGGEHLGRQLASAAVQIYTLPDEEIIREMDLNSWVFVVHRGKIIISENGEKVNSLTKGSLFGLLDGSSARPIKITAKSEGYSDLLQINSKQFQDFIDDDIRETIANHPQSKNDYIATRKHFSENPHDTIQFILRGRKSILLPWMKEPMEARHGNWYSRCLYIVWLVQPFVSSVTVLLIPTVEPHIVPRLYWLLVVMDLIHLANIMSEFFTVEMKIVKKKCINRVVGYRKLKTFGFYIDIISLILPPVTFLTGDINYQLIRLLRLGRLYDFHNYFCTSFKSSAAPVMLKSSVLFLIMHAMTCGWIMIACKYETFQIDFPSLPEYINKTINKDQWLHPKDRKGGCARILEQRVPETGRPAFLVPKTWTNDYLMAMTSVLLIQTQAPIEPIVAVTISQFYYQIILTLIMFIVDIWLSSVTISFVATKFRELYQYDYNVNNLILFLRHSGLSPTLLDLVQKYTTQLWRRQKGNWLPELAQQAPTCLREDMLSALYMHHLETPPLFRDLPFYFRRQLVARLKRIVIFPGKCIVQEGDIFPCIYFIHEGEVEKYYMDKSGDYKLMSLLNTNGYFGQMAGLFPNFAFQFSYYTRTVVDLVYLRLSDWQDLLDGYPDIKRNLYHSATQFRKSSVTSSYGKTH